MMLLDISAREDDATLYNDETRKWRSNMETIEI